MRVFLCTLAVVTLALFCFRIQRAMGFSQHRQEQSLHLLADPTTRQGALRIYLRGDPAETLRVIEPKLRGDSLDPEVRRVYALLYLNALAGLDPGEYDPDGKVRAAFSALGAAYEQQDRASYLLFQAITARLGSPLEFPAVAPSASSTPPSAAELEALPYWLAATGAPRAPAEILALEKFWPGLRTVTDLDPRLHAARALHWMHDPAGVDLLISALSSAQKRTLRRDIEDELRLLTTAAIAGSAGRWQEWWGGQRDGFAATGDIGSRTWFAMAPSTLVLVVFCLIVYVMIGWVRSVKRWNNGWGMIALTTAIYLVLRELIGNNLAASSLAYTPYGLRSAAYLVDTVLLPYHVILFTLLAAFTPDKKS